MTALRKVNSQMFKELHETRTDLESVKSELAKMKRSGASDYQPGMLSGKRIVSNFTCAVRNKVQQKGKEIFSLLLSLGN